MKILLKIVGVFVIAFLLISCDKPIEEPEIVEHTISFVVPEGIEALDDIEVESGKTIELPELTDIGEYQWYEDSALSIVFDEEALITKDMTLYLVGQSYDTITYYIKNFGYVYDIYDEKTNIYNPNGVTHPAPEIEGYTFIGWYLNEDYSSPVEDSLFITSASSENFSLYGKYEVNTYHMTFVLNGQSYIEYDIVYDELITLGRPQVKNGQTFSGWFLDEALTLTFNDLHMPGKDLVLYGSLLLDTEFSSYTSIEIIKNMASYGEVIEFTGIVTATFRGETYLSDGIEAIVFDTDADFEIGDKIRVVGTFRPTGLSIAITEVIETEVIQTGLENPFDVSESTIKDLIDNYFADIDQLGQKFIISGEFQFIDGNYMGIYDEFGNYLVIIIENLIDSFELRNYADKTVTLEVILLGYLYRGLNIGYSGLLDDITIIEDKDDQLSLSEDILWIREFMPMGVYYKVDIPSYAFNGSKVSNIEWSHPQYFNDYNYFVEEPENGFNFTLSLTLTKGDYSEDIELSFIYVYPCLISDIINLETSRVITINGFIYSINDDGFYLHSLYDGVYIFVNNKDALEDYGIGDSISITGNWDDNELDAYEIREFVNYITYVPYMIKELSNEFRLEIEQHPFSSAIYVGYFNVIYDDISNEIELQSFETLSIYIEAISFIDIDFLKEFNNSTIELRFVVNLDDEIIFIGFE
ncbi:InlB B-repeat-containing protein [Mariniplasma anaerobium]|uniref:InlB B-repeat-containing protein n=1 Tax=Mariniplasma anaerobium TaxID=2735436 RepID=A0A7U9XVV9_9MOLU|nr:InlB B-repeat-containing protein [Mariniplasma anaerobium]BCR35737.1 hypothetical protein MPAN_006300 [Mariniplasma anaerobium]